MERTTIDFGIDLGTTNSEIALFKGNEVEVIKNNLNAEYTPSAVWIDKKNHLHVGQTAKDRAESDPDNTAREFKLHMGKETSFSFAASGRGLTAPELSAEVLKSLRADVGHRLGEKIDTAVITVPAAFDLPQCEATKQAAKLAGFESSPLLLEPVAAAMAYGFQSRSDNVYWLVYDFGGGTFDAALIQCRDDIIQVVNHAGDNYLGGKLIDWAILDDLMTPAMLRAHPMPGFNRGDKKFRQIVAKLKWAAETAKIQLSREDQVMCTVEDLVDERGQTFEFEMQFSRNDLARVSEPFIVRSINLARKVLAEKNLPPSAVEHLLLVGGTTLMTVLRERLKRGAEGLEIPQKFDIDPITVVARGAAIFAAGQPRPVVLRREDVEVGDFILDIHYKPMGVDLDPFVAGQVRSSENLSIEGHTIEFIEEKSRWTSGRVPLDSQGRFTLNLSAEGGRQNVFHIQVRDARGNPRPSHPNSITYRVGIKDVGDLPLINSIGVAMSDGSVDQLIEKGTPLPARKRSTHYTVREIPSGQQGTVMRIVLVEGENKTRWNRNRMIGSIDIPGDQLHRDLPAGSEVEITVQIDESRLVTASAYVPLLEKEIGASISLEMAELPTARLREEATAEKSRLNDLRLKSRTTGSQRADELFRRIEEERIVNDIDASLRLAEGEKNAPGECQRRLLDLKEALDRIEDELEWPQLVAEAEAGIANAERALDAVKAGSAERARTNSIIEQVRRAIEQKDRDLLKAANQELGINTHQVMQNDPAYWTTLFFQLEIMKGTMKDQSLADGLLNQGRRAIQNGDVEALKASVIQLVHLLPPGTSPAGGNIVTQKR